MGFLRAVLSGHEATWEGRPYRLPYDIPRVRLHLAVSRPRMCRLAGSLADGAIVMGPAQPDLLREQVGWIIEGSEAAGRDRAGIEVSFVAPTSIGDDLESAIGDVRSWASAQARLLADAGDLPPSLADHREEFIVAKHRYDYAQHLSTRAEHRATISDELVSKLAIVGPASDCGERLKALCDTGIDGLIFPLLPPRRLDRLELIQQHVPAMPAQKR